jgi:amidophosphoribosyltransferase
MAKPTEHTFTAKEFLTREPQGCGVFGVFGHPDAASLTALGLHALQHRGQESAGIAATNGSDVRVVKGQGLVSEVLKPKKIRKELDGFAAVGHVRYSTTGSSIAGNAQPLLANHRGRKMAVVHNGNLTNAYELAEAVEANGAIFHSTTDSELLLHLIAQNRDLSFEHALTKSIKRLHGAWSMLLLREDEMYAFRDPRAFRPLCLGKLDDAWVVSSESCGFDIIGAQYLREVKPGEVLCFSDSGVDAQLPDEPSPESTCVFELIYYSRPDSRFDSDSIYEYRVKLGRELAREHPTEADLVIAVPDSASAAAIGFAREAGLPLEHGLVRSHYIGRTFIAPNQKQREQGARLKYNPVREILAGQRVVVVDDSIVRGTTMRKIVQMLRDSGVREVHLRISAPPWKYPCYYGIDTPEEEKLLAYNRSIPEMTEYIGCDSLGFISPDGLMKAVPSTHHYCTSCFSGRYPDRRPTTVKKDHLEARAKV